MQDLKQVVLYHGSNVIVTQPRILTHGFYKDFGYGFYCTNMERQAQRWALTKRERHVVNQYLFDPSEEDSLSICRFPDMSEKWLDFVAACRNGRDHSFDIVEGPMADDQIWDYVEDFISGEISRTAFWELVKFKYPTHQIAFCSQRSLAGLHYERSYVL